MKLCLCSFLSAFLATTLADRELVSGNCPTNCVAKTIDFEEFQAGDTPTTVGCNIEIKGVSKSGRHPAMIFDTENPTGGDFDVASDSLGKALILSEDGDTSDPDDASTGGRIKFSFPYPVEVVSIDFLDVDETGTLIRGKRVDGKGFGRIHVPAAGNNELQTVVVDKCEVTEMTVKVGGSLAITKIEILECSDGDVPLSSACLPTPVPTDQAPTSGPTSVPTPSAAPSPGSTLAPSSGGTTLAPSSEPTSTYSQTMKPSSEPSFRPSLRPSLRHSTCPSSISSVEPTTGLSSEPTSEPTDGPTPAQTLEPSKEPTPPPTHLGSEEPSASLVPSLGPTLVSTPGLTLGPTPGPTVVPSTGPTAEPTSQPTSGPTPEPTNAPTPTHEPSLEPTAPPSHLGSEEPSVSFMPTPGPTTGPTSASTSAPTLGPTPVPTYGPTLGPSSGATLVRTSAPTVGPTREPTLAPTAGPTLGPSPGPTFGPTLVRTFAPTAGPTPGPTLAPTAGATPTYGTTVPVAQDPNGWLEAHNSRRKEYYEMFGVSDKPLKWSDSLAADAQVWADELIARDGCWEYWEHDPNGYGGENLYAFLTFGSGEKHLDPETVLEQWWDEEVATNGGHFQQAAKHFVEYVGCHFSVEVRGDGRKCGMGVCRYTAPNCRADILRETIPQKCRPVCPKTGCF